MSNYAMWGLLEGVGRGITNTGEAVGKLSLQQAEEQRQMNLMRIKRQWDVEDRNAEHTYQEGREEKNFNRNQAAKIGDEERAHAYQDSVFDKTKTADEEKDKRQHKFRMEESDESAAAQARYRAPTEYDKQVDKLDAMLAAKEITPDEYKNKILGIQKTATFSAKDQAELKLKSIEQATLEIRGKDPLQPATKEDQAAINKRAAEIFQTAVGGNAGLGLLESPSTVDLHPKMVADIATRLAGATPSQLPGAIKSLQKQGVSEEQLAEIQTQAEAIKAKKTAAAEQAEEEKKKGLEQAEKGEGLLSPGAYRIAHGIPAEKPTLDPVDPNKLTHNQRRDRQSFSKSAPWLE